MNSLSSQDQLKILFPVSSAASHEGLWLQRYFKAFFENPAASEPVMKKLLLGLALRGETPRETEALIRLVESMETRYQAGVQPVLDVCGTGGDGRHTLNISTLAALVIAGAGGYVAKHGNRAVSSRCGSSDLLEALGVKLDASPDRMLKALKECGIGYFHAPVYHPLFAKVQPLRRSLGVRTLFNSLGPFLNPVRLQAQMIGGSQKQSLPFFAEILRLKGMRRAAVFHSRDGLDEISTAADTDVCEIHGQRIRKWVLRPSTLGFAKAKPAEYAGGAVSQNRRKALQLLEGRLGGGARDVVLINAAMGIYLGGLASDLKAALRLAEGSLERRRALAALKTLVKISNS